MRFDLYQTEAGYRLIQPGFSDGIGPADRENMPIAALVSGSKEVILCVEAVDAVNETWSKNGRLRAALLKQSNTIKHWWPLA